MKFVPRTVKKTFIVQQKNYRFYIANAMMNASRKDKGNLYALSTSRSHGSAFLPRSLSRQLRAFLSQKHHDANKAAPAPTLASSASICCRSAVFSFSKNILIFSPMWSDRTPIIARALLRTACQQFARRSKTELAMDCSETWNSLLQAADAGWPTWAKRRNQGTDAFGVWARTGGEWKKTGSSFIGLAETSRSML